MRLPETLELAVLRLNFVVAHVFRYAKHRLVQFNGVPKHTFYLHLKETEFRFNHRHDDLYKILLRMLRENPLK